MSVTQAEIDHLVHLTAVSMTAEFINSSVVVDVPKSVDMMRREMHTMLKLLGVKSTEQVQAEDESLHWYPKQQLSTN